jgi:DNA-binding NarL/FixJ family response regulator
MDSRKDSKLVKVSAAKFARRSRVVIADDDLLILSEIEELLSASFEVVGRAENGRELLDVVGNVYPDVVVTDISMPEMNGIKATGHIKVSFPNVKVVMLSAYEDEALITTAFAAGASGYVVKRQALTELIPAIKAVVSGKQHRPQTERQRVIKTRASG